MDSDELGHFSLLVKIGEGGMGRVYKARDTRLGRLVAIKVLPEARRTDADRRARFIQEAKAASALNHPNIITIHEVGEQDGQTFIVMELVDGKPLNELIPRKGMRLTEALRIAAQVADALTSAHAAGIVHRDLKPANIMVDAHGRVKVLDFGLAKLFVPAASAAVAADESTKTVAMDQPVTEEGVILGSIPYMSPEQAEGRPLDARSDIFSFGAVLYEMITGQRAFRGESRVSTLAAVLEKDPQPPSESSSASPPELDRLIARCLRKDVNRRSQNMADVKLALEELREESESGRLSRPAAPGAGARRWLWQVVVMACVLIAAAALTWTYTSLGTQSKAPALTRVSPEDGHSYRQPAISPDGEFVAYISDRSGQQELWLQQVGGGDPIQLTHSKDAAAFPAFFPDGRRILYVTTSEDGRKSSIDVISTLGGEPQLLIQGGQIMNWEPMLSPDGRQIAYFEDNEGVVRLVTISANGGQLRELPAWASTPHRFYGRATWTSDSRYLICLMSNKSASTNDYDHEWFAFPVDGGNPAPMGARNALRAVGLTLRTPPMLVAGDRALFSDDDEGRTTWEIRLSPGPWRVRGVPRQLTFGTMSEIPVSISAAGTIALQVGGFSRDLYLIPLSLATGQPTGVTRRLTHDSRGKYFANFIAGPPGNAYFDLEKTDGHGSGVNYYAVDLNTAKQTLVTARRPLGLKHARISPDGRQVAYSVMDGDSYSIHVADIGADSAEARILCRACGLIYGFSPDGRFLLYDREAKVMENPKRKQAVRTLEVASGRDRPWIESSTDSVTVADTLGQDSGWLMLLLELPGSRGTKRGYLVPWREEPVPQSEWTSIPLPVGTESANPWRASPTGNFYYFFEGSRLMAVRFDPHRAGLSQPQEVRFWPGSEVTLKPDDDWTVRGPGLVFDHDNTNPSVWLMKLPH
jgi:eukaryotic-like serine/threonine-protein kinase